MGGGFSVQEVPCPRGLCKGTPYGNVRAVLVLLECILVSRINLIGKFEYTTKTELYHINFFGLTQFKLTFLQVELVILLLLTIVTLTIGAQTSLPTVSYVKAIDIWMFVCLFQVCGTLVVVGIGKKLFPF